MIPEKQARHNVADMAASDVEPGCGPHYDKGIDAFSPFG
jgi:hypothetical protein